MSDRTRDKKKNYEPDGPRNLAFFKLPSFDDTQDDASDGEVWIYEATLLGNVTFDLDDPFNTAQLLDYTETDITLKLAGGQAINTSQAIVIAEKLLGQWYIIRELVVPDEES
tara:strand:- start:4503 stop:4838 length:336 start_codon:yes stop_codon:yes gene_type:complete